MPVEPTGHWQVREGSRGRIVHALWRDAEGRHKRALGPAWMRDTGRKTGRGAVVWRAGNEPRPSSRHLTPQDADRRVAEILACAPRSPTPREAVPTRHSFAEACEDWLAYVEHEKRRAPGTISDYRNVVRADLLPHFGAATSVASITTQSIDAFRSERLTAGRLAPRTVQKQLVILHAILKRAQRRGWIDRNPAADAERVTVKRSGDFNVLSPQQIEAVAEAAEDPQAVALIRFAAYTGLRMGELRALRWAALDADRGVVRVRRNLVGGREQAWTRQRSARHRRYCLPCEALADRRARASRPTRVVAWPLRRATPLASSRSCRLGTRAPPVARRRGAVASARWPSM